MNQNGPANEPVYISRTKRPEPVMNTPTTHQQTPIKNSGPHLVYVRKQHKTKICNKSKDVPIKPSEEDDKNHEQSPIKDSNPDTVPEPQTSSKLDYPKRLIVQQWEERFILLQKFLKALDESTQDDYRQMLRSLSSAELSRIAVELEKKTIQLSSEEAREVQRAKILDVQGISESKK